MRAALTMAVLALLAEGDRHGYSLLQGLRERGLGEVKGGTLYPLLARQQEANLVDHRWEHEGSGPARKVFQLTDAGRAELAGLRSEWHEFTSVMRDIIGHDRDGT